MKSVIALVLAAVIASSSAQYYINPYGGITQAHHVAVQQVGLPLQQVVSAPLAYSYAHAPAAATLVEAAPAVVAAPVAAAVVAAPVAIQAGYVAATRGSVHTAPLPAGSAAIASHHINTAPAPGTL